jgi:hypothetical protein
MQDTNMSLPRTKCATCGKVIPRRDIRDRRPQFCSRTHAGISKFQTRYEGTISGPYDRPVDILAKTKWEAPHKDSLGSEIPEGR